MEGLLGTAAGLSQFAAGRISGPLHFYPFALQTRLAIRPAASA
jgi:hypothetical protein